MCAEVDEAIERGGAELIILSDRDSNKDLAPIPSLLMLSAVHHHLIRRENRMKVGLIVEAGDVREVHHVATLIGYGASAVNPLPRDGDRGAPRALGLHHRPHAGEGGPQPHLRARQGRAEDHVQDGHLHGQLLRRRPGVRGRGAEPGARGRVLHRHRDEARRHRHRGHLRREPGPARLRLSRGRRGARARAPLDRRRVPVAP